MVNWKKFSAIGMAVLMAGLFLGAATAENWVFDDVNHNENDIFNLTNLNATTGTFTENVTASWFRGIFNWVIGTTNKYIVASFNGTTLNISLNETELNATGDLRFVNVDGDTMTGDLTIPNLTATNNITITNNLDVGGNITAGQKITFAFGEIIDNIINGIITITGDLSVSGDIDTNNGIVSEVNSIDFNLTGNASHLEGRIHWNDEDKTLDIDTNINGVSLQTGQEMYLFARNNLGFTINNSQLVYINGAQGNRPTVGLAKADSHATSEGTIAMATHECTDTSTCFFTTNGLVRDIDTSDFSEGDQLFLSPDMAGGFTSTEPEAPNHSVSIGFVTRSNVNEGVVLVHIINGFQIGELHDVNTTSEANGNLLIWNDSMSRWENGNVINNNLTVNETIFIGDRGNLIQSPDIVHDVNTSGAMRFFANVSNPSSIAYMFCAENPDGFCLPRFIIQRGGADLGSLISRSFGIIGDEVGWLNGTFSNGIPTNLSGYLAFVGEEQKIDFATSVSGADLYIGDDLQVGGDVFVKDTDNEYHFLTRELEIVDEQRDETLIVRVNTSLVTDNLTITEFEGDTLIVNIGEVNYDLNKSTDTILLTSGTNASPQLNHIYYNSAPNPVLTYSGTQLDDKANVFRGMIGANGYDLGSVNDNAKTYEFNRGVYGRFFDNGVIYLSGFDQTANTTSINFTTGSIKLLLDKETITKSHSTADYNHILNDGTYEQHTNLDGLEEYSSGESIGNNKYFNVVCGIAHTQDGLGQLYCLTQNKPVTEYTKVIDAEVDGDNTQEFFPNDDFIKKIYTPLVRFVAKNTGGTVTIQTLSNGQLFFDIRGTITTSAGASPVPGITSHSDLSNLAWSVAGHTFDTNLDTSPWNVTANWFNGLFNWTENVPWLSFDGATLSSSEIGWDNLTTYPSACPAGTFLTQLDDSVTCTAPVADDVDPGDFPTGNYSFDTSVLFIDSTNNNVGINIATPQYDLDINGDIHVAGLDIIFSDGGTPGGSNIDALSFSDSPFHNAGGLFLFSADTSKDGGNAGVQAETFYASSDIGIGTSSPKMSLDVNSAGTNNVALFTSTDQYALIHLNDSGSTDSELIRRNADITSLYAGGNEHIQLKGDGEVYFNGGNVGIGTSSPSEKLHVDGGMRVEGTHVDGGVADSLIMDHVSGNARFFSQGPSATVRGGYTFGLRESDGGGGLTPLAIQNDGDVILAETTGNVGIGTSSPENTLDVHGIVRVGTSTDTSEDSIISPETWGVLLKSDVAKTRAGALYMSNASGAVTGGLYLTSTYGITINDTGGNHVVLQPDGGNVGIGTSSPSTALDLATGQLSFNSVISGDDLIYGNNVAHSLNEFTMESRFDDIAIQGGLDDSNKRDVRIYTGDTLTAIFESSGEVGIGTDSPDARLHVKTGAGGEMRIDSDVNTPSFIGFRENGVGKWAMGNDDDDDDFKITDGTFASPEFSIRSDGYLFDTKTGSAPFYITRQGATGEAMSMYVDDGRVYFNSIQDEASGTNRAGFNFRLGSQVGQAPTFQWNDYRTGSDVHIATMTTSGLGIGTSIPAKTLHVKNNGGFDNTFMIERANQGNWSFGLSANDLFLINYLGTQEFIFEDDGSIQIREQAAANQNRAAFGQLFVKTATPNELWFRDDAGTNQLVAKAGTFSGTCFDGNDVIVIDGLITGCV